MCTRYFLELSPKLRPIIEEARNSSLCKRMIDKLGQSFKMEEEIRPTDMVPVIAPDKHGNKKVYPMKWVFFVSGIKQPLGADITWLARLYRIEEGYMGFKYPVFTILTRSASPALQKIHDRMPVMISEIDINTWIRPGKVPKRIQTVTDVVAEKV